MTLVNQAKVRAFLRWSQTTITFFRENQMKIFATAVLITACWLSAFANADSTRLLGSTRLSKAENDVDVLKFQPCRNGVNAVKIQVRKGSAEIESLWLRFANGERDTLSVRQRIAKGGESRWIDVRGGERCVSAVGGIGDTERSKRQARIDIFVRWAGAADWLREHPKNSALTANASAKNQAQNNSTPAAKRKMSFKEIKEPSELPGQIEAMEMR
jgi:Protein of unknown function (DUF2541)